MKLSVRAGKGIMKAILFGSIGTLVETSEIQRNSFNLAFKEFGLDWYWNVATYCSLLKEPGGKKRILRFSKDELSPKEVDHIHNLKEKYFLELVPDKLNLRPTVPEVLHFAKTNSIRLGFITSTSQNNIDVIKNATKLEFDFNTFDLVTTSESVNKPKPDPAVYKHALKFFELESKEVVAIEDTPVNHKCAIEAGLRCILFPGEYSEIPIENKYQTLTYNLMTKVNEAVV